RGRAQDAGRGQVKAKGKRQKAKMKSGALQPPSSLLPFAFCLLPSSVLPALEVNGGRRAARRAGADFERACAHHLPAVLAELGDGLREGVAFRAGLDVLRPDALALEISYPVDET